MQLKRLLRRLNHLQIDLHFAVISFWALLVVITKLDSDRK